MNCIFLSPHFPPQYHRFCRQLKLAGANALGIGDAPYDTLAPEVREALSVARKKALSASASIATRRTSCSSGCCATTRGSTS